MDDDSPKTPQTPQQPSANWLSKLVNRWLDGAPEWVMYVYVIVGLSIFPLFWWWAL